METIASSIINTWANPWLLGRHMLMSRVQCPGFWKQDVWLQELDKILSLWWKWSPLWWDEGQAPSTPNTMTVADFVFDLWWEVLNAPPLFTFSQICLSWFWVLQRRTGTSQGRDWLSCCVHSLSHVKSLVKKWQGETLQRKGWRGNLPKTSGRLHFGNCYMPWNCIIKTLLQCLLT